MIRETDLIHLPYTPDLTDAGIAYACRSLAYTYNRMGGSPFDRLRRIVAGVAVELAFRRYISEQAVPFDVLGATPFTQPDRYDVALGGHRCDLKSFLITRRPQIRLLRHDAGPVLQAPALVPLDQFGAEGHKSEDLYLFAFLLGLVAAGPVDVDKVIAAGQPVTLVHPLPQAWAKPSTWIPLEGLALKSECETPLAVELGGQAAGREFVTTRLELPPKKRIAVEQTFYSLAYIRAARWPEFRLGLYSPKCGGPYIIPAHAWGNIRVYGMDILLTGYLTHEEFRRRATVLNAGMPTFQYARTRTKNLRVPVADLRPLGELLEKVRRWEAEKTGA